MIIFYLYKDKSIQMVTEVQMLPEPSDYLGPHPDRLFETYFKWLFLAKDKLLVLHLEVGFESVVEVFAVRFMAVGMQNFIEIAER